MKRLFVVVAAFVSLTALTREPTVTNASGNRPALATAAQADPATITVYITKQDPDAAEGSGQAIRAVQGVQTAADARSVTSGSRKAGLSKAGCVHARMLTLAALGVDPSRRSVVCRVE
jgi:hypothetical protein